MSITSIGYGDVVLVQIQEYLVCILCMLIGGVLWASIIGSLCGVVANMDPQLTEFRQTYDSMNLMMEDQKLPNSLRLRVREYLCESMHLNRVKSYEGLQSRMSPCI